MSSRSVYSKIQSGLRAWLIGSVSVNPQPSGCWRKIERVVLCLALVGSGLLGLSSQAGAATVSVTSTTDISDGNTTSISALITTPGADGKISLREAIIAANNTAGADTIAFNIGGLVMVQTIFPTTPLPPITDTVTIDGYTQPTASPNTLAVGDNARLLIEISGQNTPGGTGLQLDADNCVIQGLVINQIGGGFFPINVNHGAIVVHGYGNTIAGNFIGTNVYGTSYSDTNFSAFHKLNGVGISISGAGSGNTTIGGPVPAARNIITGNWTAFNIQHSSGNVVAGNYIGTDIHGVPMTSPITHGSLDGPIRIFGGSINNTIGGTAAGAGNLTTVGVNLINDTATSPPTVFVPHNNQILGNSFLTDWSNFLVSNIQFVATPTYGDSDYNSGGANVSQDALDADAGPNGLQNSPSILSATVSGATTSVSLRLTTAANQTYRVEVYSDAVLNGLGTGNGRTLLGTTSLTTDASGVAQTSLTLPAVAAGHWVSATASGPDGTSEFSVAHLVQDPASAGLPLVVTNTNDSGAGSLRQAILNANAMINGPTPDVITFNIPGAGVHTIQPISALPVIGEGVLIDGYSQPGASVNTLATGTNAVLLIELSGASLSAVSNTLLSVLGSDTTIRGLVMNHAGAGSSGSGTTLALLSLASNARIEGNFIGTNAVGTAAAANPGSGIRLDNVSNSTIGGATPAARNLISGNFSGLILRGPETTGNLIAGNTIGTNAAGTAAIPNTVLGIRLGPYVANNLIGGTTAGARNLISGNGAGIDAASNWPGSLYTLGDGNRIEGNYIGTSADGSGALGNGAVGQNTTGGIIISDLNLGAGTLTIGGTTAGAGNLIAGNKGSGIVVIAYDSSPPSGTVVVQGNRIGTNAAGTAANPNQGDGIFQDYLALPLVVGGTSAAARNIISGNLGSGIAGGSYYGTALIQGNYIGADITGSQPLGNGKHGILATATGAQIGDPAMADGGNLIAFNTLNGIAVTGDVGNRISRNRIFSNGGLGIDLGNNGVTPNDAGDPDTGPNNLQNFPVLTGVALVTGNTTMRGTLNSTANTAFRIEFFSNTVCGGNGDGQGRSFLGFTTVTTDGSGNGGFSAVTLPVPPDQSVIAATATDPSGNTSEFSHCLQRAGSTSTTWSTTSITRLESPPACTPVGSSRRVETITIEDTIGPATIVIGDRDAGGTAFDVPSEWINLNVNTHTDIFQCVASTPTAPTKLTVTSVNGGINPTVGVGFNVVVQAQDGSDVPQNVAANTAVTLSLLSGTGTLGGTPGCTILAGANSCTVAGVTYSGAESNVSLAATGTSGDQLADGISIAFTVIPATVTEIPTLSEWGMLMLSGLMALSAVVSLRRRRI
ncbi:hypothetical protein CCR95_15875 [Thiocystis minor]|uniref:IPTL-CTERM sorting domain-containing protein n=1 Tax=Thiocystis minor TaxID=61597 RepID=UPI0019133354|nr:IPTL-CTERM sorting domain-containing protein [Thiocystis minor]MBK5965525.1 hypothetical protein [Thiocystis minor]